MFQNVISLSEQNFALDTIDTFEKTQRKNERRKENHRRKANYFIGKYATS